VLRVPTPTTVDEHAVVRALKTNAAHTARKMLECAAIE
jgi:hypothetical protein